VKKWEQSHAPAEPAKSLRDQLRMRYLAFSWTNALPLMQFFVYCSVHDVNHFELKAAAEPLPPPAFPPPPASSSVLTAGLHVADGGHANAPDFW
jgi:hypothetical protein